MCRGEGVEGQSAAQGCSGIIIRWGCIAAGSQGCSTCCKKGSTEGNSKGRIEWGTGSSTDGCRESSTMERSQPMPPIDAG